MKQVTVWYDQSCPLCRREIALIRRLDRKGRIMFIDASDPNTVCPIDRATILARFHAREGDRMLSGAAAFAAMWRAVPMMWPLGKLAQIPGAGWILERLYVAFLRVRPQLQRLFR